MSNEIHCVAGTNLSDPVRQALDEEIATLRNQLADMRQASLTLDSRARLAAIVESSDDAIISKSLDGTILSWNQAAERTLGYLAGEVIGKSIQVLIPPDRRAEEVDILERLKSGQTIDHFNTVRLACDGRRLDVVVSISPVRDEAGRIVGASTLLRECTDQRRAEQSVRDSEARLRGVVDSAVDGIITINEMGIIESINPSVLRIFGYAREELIGFNVKLLMPGPYFTEHDSYLANYRATGSAKIIGIGREVQGKRKDGTVFPVDLAISEVKLGDRRIFTGIVRDITERKNAEQALVRAKDAAEAASKAKEHFISVLSHELRTPLAPVLAEMSFIEAQTDISDDLRTRLGMVRRNIETEARLVDDLLDVTRISNGKVELRREVVDLHAVIRASIAMFQSAADAKSLEMTIGLRARQHHAWSDPGRIQQILSNLISNAVKFSADGGQVSIHSTNPSPDQIEIEVKDNGIGMDADMCSRLFNAFEQGPQSRRFGGLGLGLSIAQSLTKMHAGTLVARSDGPGTGSSFKLMLPAVADVPSVAQPPRPDLQSPLDRRILLVEDHDDTRAVMARLLRSLGCEVTVAASVKEAVEASQGVHFDLLISDIGLPDGTGLEVMQKLRSRVERGIAVSGFGQDEDLQRSKDAGFERHLVKPVNFQMLRDMLKRAG